MNRLLRWLPFVVIAAIWVRELFIDVIDVDSAQYAHVAVEMLQTKSFLMVHNRGMNYLDKPPLTFWLAAGSFAVFGVSTWAYKLPSLLFAILSVFSLYRLVRVHDSKRTAWTAALLFASSLALFLWTNDVRTDTILTGATTFALWQLAVWRTQGGWRPFLLGFAGIAFALMTKGPIGLIVPGAAVLGDVLARRDFKTLLSPVWIVGAGLCLLLLGPMLWGLYEQFGIAGWRFFFWTQSFGRITGSSPWHDSTTPLFFTHTILWEMLPWTPLFLIGLSRQRFQRAGDAFLFAGFLLPFLALSLSHYKLPHYLLVILPLACALTAREVDRLPVWLFRVAVGLQWLVIAALAFVGGWLLTEAFPSPGGLIVLGAGLVLAIVLGVTGRLITPSLTIILVVAGLLAWHVYPALLPYEASVSAARLVKSSGIPADHVYVYRTHPYSLDFLLERNVPELQRPAALPGEAWVFTDPQGLAEIRSAGLTTDQPSAFEDFHISQLTLPFLRQSTRQAHVGIKYLVHVRSNRA